MHVDWTDIATGMAAVIAALAGAVLSGVRLGAMINRRNGRVTTPPAAQPPEHPSGEYLAFATAESVDRAIEKSEDRIEARLVSLEASSGRRFDRLEEQVIGISRSLARLEGRIGEPSR